MGEVEGGEGVCDGERIVEGEAGGGELEEGEWPAAGRSGRGVYGGMDGIGRGGGFGEGGCRGGGLLGGGGDVVQFSTGLK